MKIQSRFTLFVTVFIGGGCLIYTIMRSQRELIDYVWCAILLYIIVKGLYVSLSKEGYEEDQRRAARGKRVYRKLFGRYAPIMPYVPILLIALSGICAYLLPGQLWLIALLLVSALVLAAWLTYVYKKNMEIEKRLEETEG